MFRKDQISEFLLSRIDRGDFPSAVYLVAEKGEVVLRNALGAAVVEPERIEANLDTIYDLASLTKPLVTGLLCVRLIEEGEIRLSDRVSKYFPELAGTEKREITIENLLTHSSGFSAWKPFYLFESESIKVGSVLSQIISKPLENSVNSKVVYSDFNFLLLGFLVEKIYRKTLDKIANEIIFDPLDLKNTFFNPPEDLKNKIAASEKGNEHEKQIAQEMFPEAKTPEYAFRDQMIWGEVHDNNCYFLGGVAGHAGLFSNAQETFKISQQFLDDSTNILKPESCKIFWTNFTPKVNQARSIAFQLAETKDSTASEALSKNSFGHLGFTGTSIWIEPANDRIFILLTNRTHDRQLPFADLRDVRQCFHRLAVKILDE